MNPSGDDYSAVVAMRNVELQTLWTRFNIYLIMNGGFLLAYVSSESGKFLNRHETISATFGFVFALLWLASELAGRHNLRHFDKKVGEFESTLWGATYFNYKHLSDKPHSLIWQSHISVVVIVTFILRWSRIFGQSDKLKATD